MSLNQPSPTLGKYRVIAELGHGGMADVYLAVVRGPVGFNKLQVIKQLRPHLAEVPDFLAMFLDEARLAARLNHPNVVQTNEVVEDGQRYFIAMEYLDGQSLDRVLRKAQKDNRLGLPLRVRILCDVLAGLHHAHELTDFDGTPLKVVHRDVTPHNVFVTYDGQTKVVDFGIAKAANCSAETRTGVLKGKISYMAPEQAQGEEVDRRADIFSVGLMLWECIADARPWKGLTDIQILNRLGMGQLPSLRDTKPDVPPELERVVQKAMSLRRDDRYATAADMQSDLEAWLDRAGGARVSSRDVGKLVSEMFAEKRAELKTLIETQLRESKPLLATGEMPVVTGMVPRLDTTGSAPTPLGTGSGRVPDLSERPDDEPTSAASPMGLSGSRAAMSTSVPTIPEQPAAKSRAPLLVGGALAVALAAAAAMVAMRGGSADARAGLAPTGTQAAPPAQTSQTAPASTLAELTLKASPSDAKLFLDDAPLADNPFKGKLPRDGAMHRVRAEAPGHAPRTEIVKMEGDVQLDLNLDKAAEPEAKTGAVPAGNTGRGSSGGRAPQGGKAAQAAPAETAAPQPPATTDPTAPKKNQAPKRQLDNDDPWAH